MPDIQISDLNPTPGLTDTDQFATKQGAEDYRATLQEISDFILGNDLDANTILTLLKTVDTDSSGLNANTLQGFVASFFRDAANLNANKVPDARLPQGSVAEYFVAGGGFGTGRNNVVIKIPSFLLGGQRIMIQFGYSWFISENTNQGRYLQTYAEPFASGWGVENKPVVFVTPQCRSESWPGDGNLPGSQSVELNMKLHYQDLSKFRVTVVRDAGSGGDSVRANWLAIGKY